MTRLPAYPLYLALAGASSLFYTMVFTVASVYRVTTAGLSPLELVLIGTALETAVFLFEIPTGVVADVYSRRLSIIIGFLIVGAAFVLQGLLPFFAAILLTEALWGIGFTFTSGAQDAWIADEIGVDRATPAYLRAAQVGQVAALAGTVLSVALASVQIALPIVAAGALFVALGLCLAITMPEQGFHPALAADRRRWQSIVDTARAARDLVARRPVLLTILAIGAVYGMASEAFDRLWEARFLAGFQFPSLGPLEPIVWFGIINAVDMLLGLAAVEVARRRLDTASHGVIARALLATNVWLAAFMIAFGLAGRFDLALVTYWAARMARHVNEPLYTAWVNQSIDDSAVRATVISASSQANALGQILGGPVVGAIGNVFSIRAAIVAAGLILSPVVLLYRSAMRQRPPD